MDSALPRVAVLCGGAGSRLGELTKDLPKPMIAIGGRPYLERVVDSFSERGFGEFVFLTGFRHDVIESHFGDGARFGVSVTYSREIEPLGTGGAVREARPLLGSRFILTYGDVLRRFDYDRFVQRHPRNCVAAYPRIAAGNTAVEGGLVVVYDKRSPDLPYIDAGFSVMHSDVLDMLPASGACSFEEIVFPLLAAERELECEVVDHDFFDIGTPDELQRTRAALEDR
ncbi:MAG: sugar phosphate nucleotidyltransferase [Thermoanaerobaculia bacterium]